MKKLISVTFLICFISVAYGSSKSKLDLGINFYEHGDYKKATKTLLKITYPMKLKKKEDRIKAFKYLGLSYFAQNKEDEAKKEFINLLKLDENFKFDPLFVNPETISFFKNLKQEFEQAEDKGQFEKEIIAKRKEYTLLGGFIGVGFLYNEIVGGFKIEGTGADINGGVGFNVYGGFRFPENFSLQGVFRFSSQSIDGNPNLATFTGFGGDVKYTWKLFSKLEQYCVLGYLFQLLTIGSGGNDLKGNGITVGTGFEFPIHKFFVLALPINYTYTSYIKKATQSGIIGLLTDTNAHSITVGVTVYVRF